MYIAMKLAEMLEAIVLVDMVALPLTNEFQGSNYEDAPPWLAPH